MLKIEVKNCITKHKIGMHKFSPNYLQCDFCVEKIVFKKVVKWQIHLVHPEISQGFLSKSRSRFFPLGSIAYQI